jgi:predicted lipid-binding transport protein (Tim44 family)
VASPDTDELATIPVPLPAGAPDAETAPQERVEPERIESANAEPADGSRPDADSANSAPAEDSPEHEAEPAKQGGRWWRGFTGSLAAGLVALAIGVLVVAGVCLYTGVPGPGAVLLVGHPIAAALALLAQRVADRRNGAAAVGGGVAVVLFTVSALTLFWLT